MGTDSTARNNVRLWWQLFGSELTSADSPPNPFTDSDGDGTPDLAEAILFTDPLTAPDTTPAPERAARHAAHQQRRRQLQSRRSRDLKPLRDLANKTRRTFPGGHASYKEWHLTQRAAVRHFAAQPTIPYQEQRRALEQFARQRGATVNPGDGSRELHELTFLDGFGFPLEMEVKGDWADTFIPESHPIDGMFPFPIGMWEVNGYPLEDHIEFVGPYGGTEPRINPESPSVSSRALLAGALCFDDTSLLPGETVPSGALLCPTYSDPNFPGEVFPGRLPPFAYDSHATGVANVLIGVGYDTPARGVAYKGSLHAYHSDWDILTMYQAAAGLTLQYDGLDPNSPATPLLPHILVSNHSYANTTRWHRQVVAGIPAGWSCYGSSTATIDGDFGTYAKITQDTDELVYHFRHYLPVWGAGNDRSGMTAPGPPIHDDGVNPPYRDPYTIFETGTTSTLDRQPDDWNDGWGTLPNTATAKNTLVVGAVYGIASKPLASYSSCGPTFDRRIKPDLVAVGSGVYSAKAKPSGDYIESGQPFNRLPAILTDPSEPLTINQAHDTDCEPTSYFDHFYDYKSRSGTSLSAPIVAGGINLLHELAVNLADTEYWFSGASATHPPYDPGPFWASTMRALAIHTAQDLGTPGPDYLENDSEEAPPDFLVEWGATPGKRYQVDTSIDLKTWTAIPGETVATAGTASYIHSAADSPAAYVRVSQLPD